MSVTAAVITCSDTASRKPEYDRSGPLARQLLSDAGLTVVETTVVPDDEQMIGKSVTAAIDGGAGLVVLTGGTGLGPRDVTPEALVALAARPLPGIGEAMRARSRDRFPGADLSRGGAWTHRGTLILALPGSPGGVRDGWRVAAPLVEHAVAMLRGGNHDVSADARESGHPAHPTEAAPHPTEAAAWVSEQVIDIADVTAAVHDPSCGAVVVFEGRVRNHDHGRDVASLQYVGHPDADRILHDVVAEALALPGVRAAAARHRLGDLAIGDLVYAVAVSAAHRREAFEACSWLVDTAKERLPIWKHQEFGDGTSEWVNCP